MQEHPSDQIVYKRVKVIGDKQKRRRLFLKRATLVLLGVGVFAALGFYLFAGWRARDLARKARASLEAGDYRSAFLQLFSARGLRKDEPAVVRSGAILEGRVGWKTSLALWDQLASRVELSDEDRLERTVATLKLGTDEQFANAVREFEQSGDPAKAFALRVTRFIVRGDLDGAVAEARRGAQETGDPYLRLDVAKILHQRHRAAAADDPLAAAARLEMISVIDSLLSTPAAEQAITFGLGNMRLPDDVRKRWVGEGMKNLSEGNLALLPAVDSQVQARELTVQQVHQMLLPVFQGADLNRRASYALWLSNNGLPKESLALIVPDEAIAEETAFVVRANALARDGKWDELLDTAEQSKAPESIRMMTRAQAEAALGREENKDVSVRQAVVAAAREGKLEPILEAADGIGASKVADAELLNLCGNPGTAGVAFHLLRERLGRTAGTDALADAYNRATTAAPDAPAARDFARYLSLFEGGMPASEETAAAVEEEPGNMARRINHALLLVRYSRPDEAKAALSGVTIFYPQLPAAYQAVLAVVAGANGEKELASQLRSGINLALLNRKEKALLDQFAPAD